MIDDWTLPQAGVMLNREELMALDWHLCGHYLVGRGTDIGEVIEQWHEFRERIWGGVLALSEPKDAGLPLNGDTGLETLLALDDGDAKYLFNALPTTFMWGTGRDVGYTLKVKLYRFVAGVPEPVFEERKEETDGDKAEGTEGEASIEAAAPA